MKQRKFLTAEWRRLIIANYKVNADIPSKFLPAKTELDFFNGATYLSLVGFMFQDVRVMGVRIPFHVNFPEVNLRFYVKHKENYQWKRGVVFIKEFVPRPFIMLVANTFFHEHYSALPMNHIWKSDNNKLTVGYYWKKNAKWYTLEAEAENTLATIKTGSEEEFIMDQFWGYTAINERKTSEYHVEHSRWSTYPLRQHKIVCDFKKIYGNDFAFLNRQQPDSVFLAEGSPIIVYKKRVIS